MKDDLSLQLDSALGEHFTLFFLFSGSNHSSYSEEDVTSSVKADDVLT